MIDKLLFGAIFLASLCATVVALNEKKFHSWRARHGEEYALRRKRSLLLLGPPLLFFSAIVLALKLLVEF